MCSNNIYSCLIRVNKQISYGCSHNCSMLTDGGHNLGHDSYEQSYFSAYSKTNLCKTPNNALEILNDTYIQPSQIWVH